MYKLACQCNTTLSYVRYTAHIWSQAREHLNFNSAAKSAVEHLYFCSECMEKHFRVYDFIVLNKCCTEYEVKIQEALVIKKQNSKLNRQLYANS